MTTPEFATFQCYHDGQGFESRWACEHHVAQTHPEFGPASCRRVTAITCQCGQTFDDLATAEAHTTAQHGATTPQEPLTLTTADD